MAAPPAAPTPKPAFAAGVSTGVGADVGVGLDEDEVLEEVETNDFVLVAEMGDVVLVARVVAETGLAAPPGDVDDVLVGFVLVGLVLVELVLELVLDGCYVEVVDDEELVVLVVGVELVVLVEVELEVVDDVAMGEDVGAGVALPRSLDCQAMNTPCMPSISPAVADIVPVGSASTLCASSSMKQPRVWLSNPLDTDE
jgi:hypothetical protein